MAFYVSYSVVSNAPLPRPHYKRLVLWLMEN